MILELRSPIEMDTPKGRGFAHYLIDYGLEHDLVWVVFCESGEIWSVRNPEVRLVSNWTYGRKRSD